MTGVFHLRRADTTQWRLASIACTLALLLLLAACGDHPRATDEGEWVKPFEGWLPGGAPANTAVFLILDGRTRAPIEGALVQQCYEQVLGPEGWAPVAREGRTNEHGLVWFELGEEEVMEAHWVVRAEGFAPTETYGKAVQEEIELWPGQTLHGRVLDALGRPVRGMRLGYKIGCAHAPWMVEARTDADGYFVFEHAENGHDLTFDGPGVLQTYWGEGLHTLDQDPAVCVAEPGVRIEGRITGVNIRDLDPGVVRSIIHMRGVVAPVRPDGTFTLDGVEPDTEIELHELPERGALRFPIEVRRGVPLHWDTTRWKSDLPTDPDVETIEVRLEVVDAQGAAVRPTSVRAYRAGDALEVDFAYHDSDAEDPARDPLVMHLAPGAYDLIVGAETERWFGAAQRIEVTAEKATSPFVLRAHEQPRLVVTGEALDLDELGADVIWAGPDGRIDMESIGIPAYMPAEVQARARVEVDGTFVWGDVGPAVGGVRHAVLRHPDVVTVRFRADADTISTIRVAGESVEWGEATGGFVQFKTHRTGRLPLSIMSRDASELVERTVEIPAAATGPVTLAPFTWPAPPDGQVTVFTVEGKPYADAQYDVDYYDEATGREVSLELMTDEHGVDRDPDLRPDRLVTWYSPRGLHRALLVGNGPWVLRPGGASLRLDVRGPAGGLAKACIMVDGELRDQDRKHDKQGEASPPGRYTLMGLEPGPHTLIVSAPGHRGEIRRVVLGENEARSIDIVLR